MLNYDIETRRLVGCDGNPLCGLVGDITGIVNGGVIEVEAEIDNLFNTEKEFLTQLDKDSEELIDILGEEFRPIISIIAETQIKAIKSVRMIPGLKTATNFVFAGGKLVRAFKNKLSQDGGGKYAKLLAYMELTSGVNNLTTGVIGQLLALAKVLPIQEIKDLASDLDKYT